MTKKQPEIDTNPYRCLEATITPTEFEVFCLETVKAYAAREGLKDFIIKHNQKIEAHDSTYQIDVYAEYTALGCNHKVIIECKRHSGSIERPVVTDLCAKLQSIGAQKGIIISTSGFQRDAVRYAKEHGIALWQIIDSRVKHIVNCIPPEEMYRQMMWRSIVDYYLPKYFVREWDFEYDFPYTEIYPTPQMYKDAEEKARDLLKARGNYNV